MRSAGAPATEFSRGARGLLKRSSRSGALNRAELRGCHSGALNMDLGSSRCGALNGAELGSSES
eukprot:7252852-Alexandrium_andersonii.AAC.1